MRAAWLAAEYGLEISLGNTSFEVGVHLAAALPECRWMEYSFQNYDHLLAQPVERRDGFALAPDRPGHGLTLADRARSELAVPDVLDPRELPTAPAGPLDLPAA
jgi:L-alanine-DL-glutamate epimerase-like enolase superfamily enzyme